MAMRGLAGPAGGGGEQQQKLLHPITPSTASGAPGTMSALGRTQNKIGMPEGTPWPIRPDLGLDLLGQGPFCSPLRRAQDSSVPERSIPTVSGKCAEAWRPLRDPQQQRARRFRAPQMMLRRAPLAVTASTCSAHDVIMNTVLVPPGSWQGSTNE